MIDGVAAAVLLVEWAVIDGVEGAVAAGALGSALAWAIVGGA